MGMVCLVLHPQGYRLPQDDPRSDESLIAAANQGDADAFAALYHRHRDWAVRLARRFTRSDDDALDVLQETFIYFFRKFPGFQLSASITTFLYPVVKNLSLALRRKRDRYIGDWDSLDSVESMPLEPGDPRTELSSVLIALGPHHREVVLMRFVDGMSLEEIATSLSVPLGTVKSRLHHALNVLRDDPRTLRYFDPI